MHPKTELSALSGTEKAIYLLLHRQDFLTVKDFLDEGYSQTTFSRTIKSLIDAGIVVRSKRGVYRLAEPILDFARYEQVRPVTNSLLTGFPLVLPTFCPNDGQNSLELPEFGQNSSDLPAVTPISSLVLPEFGQKTAQREEIEENKRDDKYCKKSKIENSPKLDETSLADIPELLRNPELLRQRGFVKIRSTDEIASIIACLPPASLTALEKVREHIRTFFAERSLSIDLLDRIALAPYCLGVTFTDDILRDIDEDCRKAKTAKNVEHRYVHLANHLKHVYTSLGVEWTTVRPNHVRKQNEILIKLLQNALKGEPSGGGGGGGRLSAPKTGKGGAK